MVSGVFLALFPLVALSSCPEGDGSCPSNGGQRLLQASMNPGHDLLAMQVSSGTAERLLHGVHVDLGDIGKYMESLVADVIGHNHTMSDAEKKSVEIIEQMVGKMQKASDTEHAEDQAEVDRMRDIIQACTSDANASLAEVAAHNESVSSTRTAHAACRGNEALAKDAADLACVTYDSYRGSKNNAPPPCMAVYLSADYVVTDDSAKKKLMESCLEEANSWVPPFYTKYEDCKSKKAAHKINKTGCDSKQKAFEQAFCTYESKLEDTCDEQTSCREKAIIARNAAHDGVKKSETARKSDFAASRRLLCFLDVLNANNTHKEQTLQRCQNLDDQTSKYDITYPSIPPPTDCAKEATKPCDSNWTSQQYETQVWYKKANADTCQPCVLPATTTTTSTPTPTTTTTTTTITATTITTTTTAAVGQSMYTREPDGTVSSYRTASGKTLAQCYQACSDGTWVDCIGFSRYSEQRGYGKGDNAPGSCWWVTSRSNLQYDDGNDNEDLYIKVSTTTTTSAPTATTQVATVKSCIIKSKQGAKVASCNAGWCDFKAYPSYNCAGGPVVDKCQGEAGFKFCKEEIKQKKPFPNGKVYQLFNHVTGSTRGPCVGELVEKSNTAGVKEFWFPHGGWQERGDRHMWFYCG